MTICSSAFETLGRAQARALGNPGLPIAVIPHPFGLRNREEVRRMAERCAADIAGLVQNRASEPPVNPDERR
ncbi:MAG: hypothetical protein IT529_10440 [Burkholderiales bacterium]|nr:hypothetical protein [Burkholderiales bacterium]